MSHSSEIKFNLHNENHTVRTIDIAPETTLLQYLRDVEHLKGTKYMCLEGGCGACIVSVTAKHPITKRTVTFSINSCLVSVYSCDGWTIHTIDGIGNQKIGYHPIQKTLAAFNGTQCGFCSPGMVMNMYSLYESNKLTMRDIEDSFGSNMCRCTGYRPILTAFKSLAEDASGDVLGECPDIEDLHECPGSGKNCEKKCGSICTRKSGPVNYLLSSGSKWFRVFSINEIFDVFQTNPESSYMLVAGNTTRGVYPLTTYPDIYIDITSVTTLLNYAETPDVLTVGANTTLNDTIALFERVSKRTHRFSYLSKLASHITLVAHVAVRNIGTIAGNLSIKHDHPEFPSDIFLILETVGATLTIVNPNRDEEQHSLVDYLSYNMNRKVIKSVQLPALDDTFKYGSYKIMPRAQNAHALVNAGFLLRLDRSTVISARIVYGGINPSFVHATTAEQYLVGKNIFSNQTLQGVFKILDSELQPNVDPPNTSPKFRKDLAIALFYKYVLSIAPEHLLSPENRSGSEILTRPISKGVQDYQTNKSMYPLTKPVQKIEALLQTSGELEYVTDIVDLPGQLFAYFVVANVEPLSIIRDVDTSQALKFPGVVAYYDKNDVPGLNYFVTPNTNYNMGLFPPQRPVTPEELFCTGTVLYYFQPVGMIVAESQEIAERAARLVKITYASGDRRPLFTVRQVLKEGARDRILQEAQLKRVRKGNDVQHVVKGTYDTNWQYHYHMETQVTAVIPKEDTLTVYAGTQWLDIIQTSIADMLNIHESKIDVRVKRLGGGFGGKLTRNAMLSCGAALAAYKLQKPVKMRMTFSTNMDVIGKRYATAANYEVGLNDKGEIQYLDCDFYFNYGIAGNEPYIMQSLPMFYNCYVHDTWAVTGSSVTTNVTSACWMRAPGINNSHAMIEAIMEHLSMELNIPSAEIRLRNMGNEQKPLLKFIKDLRSWSDYDNRLKKIEQFNQENRWRKKGLQLDPMNFEIIYFGNQGVQVSIFAGDGTVAVTHGGVEVGQGINTKVAQVVAFALKVPLDTVSIKPNSTTATPNNFLTGGSITTETVCYAALRACDTILERMEPVRRAMHNPTWKQLVKQCYLAYVSLEATYTYTPNDPPQQYSVYGVCVTEVEVDILTGVHQVVRVDLLEDTGTTLSPLIDIGQVEGAFIMGLGFWTTEELVYNEQGKLLNDRTWNYHIPGALDIPIDFRVKFPSNNPNPLGVLHSKATGEPPICLAVSIPLAIRKAVASARKSSDPNAHNWYPINGPSTVENTFLNSLNKYEQYKL